MSDIESLLKFDPIDHAEKLTGGSYKTDEGIAALGMLFAIEHGQRKAQALQKASDSFYGITFDEFVALAHAEGFTTIASRNFVSEWKSDEGKPYNETMLYMWNPEGVLLTVESYAETRLNSAKIRYNLDFGNKIPDGYHNFTSSGHFVRGPKDEEGCPTALPVWAGDHDVREGFRYTLNKLRSVGLLPVWREAPFMWLLTYMDTKTDDYDYNAINAEVIATFPEYVQKAIAGE